MEMYEKIVTTAWFSLSSIVIVANYLGFKIVFKYTKCISYFVA